MFMFKCFYYYVTTEKNENDEIENYLIFPDIRPQTKFKIPDIEQLDSYANNRLKQELLFCHILQRRPVPCYGYTANKKETNIGVVNIPNWYLQYCNPTLKQTLNMHRYFVSKPNITVKKDENSHTQSDMNIPVNNTNTIETIKPRIRSMSF